MRRSAVVWLNGHPRAALAISAELLLVLAVWDFLTVTLPGIGQDFRLYESATRMWLAGGAFYPAHQLAGPYDVSFGDILYPPLIIPLVAPFTVLPSVLWWILPIGAGTWAIARLDPAPWSWPFIALCLGYPQTSLLILAGNPVMWIAAAVALGVHAGWPATLALLKPSLFPFALVGIRRRSWWVALAGMALVSLLFLPLWSDYVRALANTQTRLGILYSIGDVPLMLIPILAHLARRRVAPGPPVMGPTGAVV